MLSSRKSIFESFVKTAPICCHFFNLCISFYNLWDTFFDFLLRIDIYLHLLNRFALFLDMCPLICEDALLESSNLVVPIVYSRFLHFVFCFGFSLGAVLAAFVLTFARMHQDDARDILNRSNMIMLAAMKSVSRMILDASCVKLH